MVDTGDGQVHLGARMAFLPAQYVAYHSCRVARPSIVSENIGRMANGNDGHTN